MMTHPVNVRGAYLRLVQLRKERLLDTAPPRTLGEELARQARIDARAKETSICLVVYRPYLQKGKQ